MGRASLRAAALGLCLLLGACGDDGTPPVDAGTDAAPRDAAQPADAGEDAALPEDAGGDAELPDGGTPDAGDAGRMFGPSGTPDTTFGTAGIVTGVGARFTLVTSVGAQDDGKVLVGGAAMVGGEQVMAVVRLNPDGSRDPDFGPGTSGVMGLVAFDLHPAAQVETVGDLAVTPTGQILVAGGTATFPDLPSATGDLVVLRLDPTGELDPGFGTGGIYTFTGGGGATALRLIDGGAQIAAAGYRGTPGDIDAVVVRLTADGDDDPTWNGGSPVTDNSTGYVADLRVRTDGRILVAGSPGVRMTRFEADGDLDPSFGMGGRSADAAVVAVQTIILQGGPFVACGSAPTVDDDFTFGRYLATGGVDTSFAIAGYRAVPMTEAIGEATEQPDGMIVAVGSPSFTIVRITADGDLDTTFGTGGHTTTPVTATASAVARMSDGRIVVGGKTDDDRAMVVIYFP